MDIIIFTIIGANNIGAFLQAFSLLEVLKTEGYNPAFARINVPTSNGATSKLGKIIRYACQGKIQLLLYKIRSKKKYDEARKHMHFKDFDESVRYDAAIIGSDEVWNVSSSSFIHYPQYFGEHLNADRIISYAPSAGNTTIVQMQKSEIDFHRFTSLSVRDQMTYDLVCSLDKRKPEIVLDPTFLIDSYEPFLPKMACNTEYILVYSYGENVDIKRVKEFSKKVNLPLYSVGTYNSWCHKNIIVSPFEFLSYLKQAKYVVTSTFHGTALSIKFNKQFVVYPGTSKKILSLLNDFSLNERNAAKSDDLHLHFSKEIDYVEVNKVLEEKRAKSLHFLLSSLGGNRGGQE